MRIPISEFQRRSISGPVMKEDEFNLKVAFKAREVVKKHGIKFNPDEVIPDDETSHAVFEAAVDMLSEVGLFNKDSHRVIELFREEVLGIASAQMARPGTKTIGRNGEAYELKRRKPDDKEVPLSLYAASISPMDDDKFIPYVKNFAQEETCKGFAGMPASLKLYDGLDPKSGAPSEAMVALRELEWTLQALREVGRPDLWIGPTWVAATPGAITLLLREGLMEPHNGQIAMHTMPELKLDWDRLTLAYVAEERNIEQWVSPSACVGLICSRPPETAVTTVAALLGQLGYGNGQIALSGAYDRWGSTSSRAVQWAGNAAKRAAGLHIGTLEGQHCPADAGAGTEMACFERAAQVISGTGSGASWVFYPACRMGLGEGHTTGLEGRFMAETAEAVAGMSREDSNALLQRVLALYEDDKKNDNVPEGETFLELYDLDTLQPHSRYLDVHKKAKEKLAAAGLNYKQ